MNDDESQLSESLRLWRFQSVTWNANSCHVDATLALLEAVAYALRRRGAILPTFASGVASNSVSYSFQSE